MRSMASSNISKGGARAIMRVKLPKKAIVLSIILISTVLTIAIVFFLLPPKDALLSEDMKNYAETFVATYESDVSFFFSRHRTYFPFYSNLSYVAKAVISKLCGSALLIKPSDEWLYQYEIADERVEKVIFGGDWSTWPMVETPPAGHHITIHGGIWETSGHPFIKIGENGSVILQNITVNSLYYHCVILKGSNETTFWTTELAKEDAKQVFGGDLGIALSESEEIRKRYAEPELTTLLEYVIEKLKDSGTEYSYLEMEEDIAFIERLARSQYGITEPSDFVKSILDFLNTKTTLQETPQKTIFGLPIEDPSNWIYVSVWCVYPPSTFILYLVLTYFVRRFRARLRDFRGWGKAVFGTLLGGGVSWLLFNPPHDYQVFSIQTLMIIIIPISSIVAIHVIHDYLRKSTKGSK